MMVLAFATGCHMPTKRLCTTGTNGGHHPQLIKRDMPHISPPPRRAMSTKDICDLQLGPRSVTPDFALSYGPEAVSAFQKG